MTMIEDTQVFVSHFGKEANQPEIISGLQSLAKLYAISVEDLYIKWEQFSCQKPHSFTTINVRSLDLFKQFLQNDIEKRANSSINNSANTSSTSSSIKVPKTLKGINGNASLYGFNIPKTPIVNKKRKLGASKDNQTSDNSIKLEFTPDDQSSTPNSSVKMEGSAAKKAALSTSLSRAGYDENKTGNVMDSLNINNLEVADGLTMPEDITFEVKPRIQVINDQEKYKFRTMRQNLVECSDLLDDQIDQFLKLIKESFSLADSEFGDPAVQSQADIYAVGRIVPDSPQADGFLNPESLSLETSRISGIGKRIRLNLEHIQETSLFCGQIVALKGKNANGDYFLVEEVLNTPYPDFPLTSSEELNEFQSLMKDQTTKTIVTSGPYTSQNDFNLDFLTEFVERVNTKMKPHVLVMFGPFIDVTDPRIMSGNLPIFKDMKVQPKTLDELFVKLITPILRTIHPSIQVILIPSTKDAISTHASYPQDAFDRKSLQLPKNFKCLTNPSTFQINEAYVGCSNVDIFKDLKEVTKGSQTLLSNRFDRISEHVLQQRRYYPQFPGSIKKVTLPNPASKNNNSPESKIYKHISGADLEVSYLGLTEFVSNVSPDIIIIPSELYPFARVVKNVIMINPGRFIKPNGDNGSFAQISIKCPDSTDPLLTKIDGEDELYLHNIWKRSRVDIITN